MAKKKLSRDQKRKQKKQQRVRRQRNADDRLIKRVQRDWGGAKVVHNPAGVAKMSDVLSEFIEPYRESTPDTADAMRKLITTASIAWNTALLPAEERAGKLQKLIAALPEDIREDFTGVIDDMIERKEKYFAHYDRMILDFELTDQGGGDYHISVMATMPGGK
jgi:hypothetical protein